MELTLRELIAWAINGRYNLDKPIRFEMQWTDIVKEHLPKEEILYMPVVGMTQYDWGIVLTMGEKE